MQTVPNDTLSFQPMALQTEPIMIEDPTLAWIILGAGVALVAGWFYIQSTHCWNKPVSRMPGWCLTAPVFGLR